MEVVPTPSEINLTLNGSASAIVELLSSLENVSKEETVRRALMLYSSYLSLDPDSQALIIRTYQTNGWEYVDEHLIVGFEEASD